MNNLLKLSIIGAAVAAPLTLAALAGASGPNLLENGDFSSGTASWGVKQDWPPASLAADNGHLVVTNESDLHLGTFGAAIQCVTGVAGGADYRFEADAYDPSGQPRDGDAVLRIFWFDSNDCSGNSDFAPIGPNSQAEDEWEHLVQESQAPAGAHSALVMLISSKDAAHGGQSAQAPHIVHFDNAYFGVGEDEPSEEPTEEPTDEPTEEPAGDPTEDPTPPADDPEDEQDTPDEGTPGAGEADDTAAGGSAPAPPNTGTGTAKGVAASSTLGLITAMLVLAGGASASAGGLLWAVARRRR